MDLNKDDIERDEILYRYFRKELSPDENAEVEAWSAKSSENQQIFDETRILFLDLKGLAYYRNVVGEHTDRSWERFKKDNNVRRIEAASSSYTYLKYAASVLIVVSAAIGIYFYQNQVEEVTLASADTLHEVTIPDGSAISLNGGASLEYATPFQNNERRVKLSGEAYFDVAISEEKPFVVEVGEAEVRVLGTRFFINRPSDNEINVQVEEGKVLFSYRELHQIIEAGETRTLDLRNNLLVDQVDETGLSTFWKNRKLVFNLTSLEEVIQTVNKAYDTTVQLDGSAEGCSLTVTFENEEFQNVMEVISSTLNYQVVEDQGTLILRGDGCQ